MLAVFVASAAWIVALLGLGHLIVRRIAPGADPGTTGLLGFVVLAVAGTVLHFFLPLSPYVAGAALLLGIAAFARWAREILRGTPVPLLLGLVALLAIFAPLNDFPIRHYDMGLYWLQTIRWLTEHRIVGGLATLHVRLGFNSSWFVAAAMLEHPLAVGRSAFLASTALLFFASWIAIDAVRRAVGGERDLHTLLGAGSLLLVVECLGTLGGQSTDTAGAIFAFAAMIWWARAMATPEPPGAEATLAALLALFATTVKLSYGVLPAAGLAWMAWERRRLDRRTVLRIAVVAGALLVPWVLHGYATTGCPLYPSDVGCLPFPWTTPAYIGEEQSNWIRSWARAPGVHFSTVLGSWAWLTPWWSRISGLPSLRALATALALAGVAIVLLRRSARLTPASAWLFGAGVAGTASWFVLAPDPRFGLAWLFALGLVPTAEAGTVLWRRFPGAPGGIALAAALALGVAWIQTEPLAWLSRVPASAFTLVDWREMPRPPTIERETLPGLRVQVPQGTDQCWSAPLPCTPQYDPGLAYDRFFHTAAVRRAGP